jgi:hypothetical protein
MHGIGAGIEVLGGLAVLVGCVVWSTASVGCKSPPGWTRFVPHGMVVGVMAAVLLDGVLNDRLGATDGFRAAVATGLGLFALALVLWRGGGHEPCTAARGAP